MSARRGKFNNRKTECDGIVFDSAKEARRYQELRLLEKAGEIWDLECQPEFVLCAPSTTGVLRHAVNGRGAPPRLLKLGVYRGDFKYRDKGCDGSTVPYRVEDVKGFKTALYKWKKKHVEAQYGVKILET